MHESSSFAVQLQPVAPSTCISHPFDFLCGKFPAPLATKHDPSPHIRSKRKTPNPSTIFLTAYLLVAPSKFQRISFLLQTNFFLFENLSQHFSPCKYVISGFSWPFPPYPASGACLCFEHFLGFYLAYLFGKSIQSS